MADLTMRVSEQVAGVVLNDNTTIISRVDWCDGLYVGLNIYSSDTNINGVVVPAGSYVVIEGPHVVAPVTYYESQDDAYDAFYNACYSLGLDG